VHTTGLPPVQMPAWHVSVRVHPLLSLQDAPSDFVGFEHVPVAGSHVPTPWHWSLAVQTMTLLPMHVPSWQVSVRVHALLSVQGALLVLGGFVQSPVAVSHVPMV
jgi:hypothetical protein